MAYHSGAPHNNGVGVTHTKGWVNPQRGFKTRPRFNPPPKKRKRVPTQKRGPTKEKAPGGRTKKRANRGKKGKKGERAPPIISKRVSLKQKPHKVKRGRKVLDNPQKKGK